MPDLIRIETRRPFGAGFLEPTAAEIKAVVSELGLTGAEAGQLLGVDARTIRRWTNGERSMPYAAWRLLLIEAGLAINDQTGQ